MKIFLVCSTSKSWMNTGYGHSLLVGDADRLLVSFVEFSKDPNQQLEVTTMTLPYVIPGDTKDTPSKPGRDSKQIARVDHGTAMHSMITNHADEIFDEGGV